MAVVTHEDATAAWSPSKPVWHRSAPRRVAEKYESDDLLGGWTAWQKHLARRRRPLLPNFHEGKSPPMLWGWPHDAVAELAGSHHATTRSGNMYFDIQRAARWVLEEDSPSTPPNLIEAIHVLALAYGLPTLAQQRPPESWWRLVERLYDLAIEAQHQRIDWLNDPQNLLRQQLLAGELGLALSYLFPELSRLRALRKGACAVLSEALVEVTDGQGLPHARLLPVLGPLFACWTRARWIGSRLARGPWSRNAEYQYQWLVRHIIRMADEGGRFALSPAEQGQGSSRGIGEHPTGSRWSKPLISMALDLAGDSGDCAAASAALSRRVVPKHIKFGIDDLPDASLDSDWSGITVMSNGWSRSALRLAVSYADDPVRIELTAGGERLCTGPWTFATTSDDQPVQIVGEWEELCWQSDKHADFLELAIDLSNGLRLERQLLLGKRDRVLYLADLVLASDGQPRRLQHSMHLPLSCGTRWQREAETRDGHLFSGKLRAAALPLALPEWRADPRGGELAETDGRLVLTQESHGRAMCCPLFLDLKPSRAKKERTWRQLTVAEWMEIVPRDVAVGFRAQSGRGQWLLYRSLGPAGNRTVMGQNIAGEFYAGRFHSTGKFDDWLEIEASE